MGVAIRQERGSNPDWATLGKERKFMGTKRFQQLTREKKVEK